MPSLTRNQPILGTLLLVGLLLGLCWGAKSFLETVFDRPDVHISHNTGECVRVVNGDGSPGRCDALPRTYNRTWVE